MVNHARTLLLNLSRLGDTEEFISEGFKPVVLPAALQSIYLILFPETSSRRHKLMLAHTYLTLLSATDFKDQVLTFDSRLTYDLSTPDFFQINNLSIPAASDPAFPLFLTGALKYDKASLTADGLFQVQQVGNSNVITVTSLVDNSILYTGTLTFTDGVSNQVTVPGYDIKFYITGTGFTATPNKEWTFSMELANKPDFLATYATLAAGHEVEAMFHYKRKESTAMYENLWIQHFNSVYRFAGLLLGYIERVHNLYVGR